MDALYQSRLDGLTDQIDNYLWLNHEQGALSEQQQAHLKELCEQVYCFGQAGVQWHDMGMQVLNELKAA